MNTTTKWISIAGAMLLLVVSVRSFAQGDRPPGVDLSGMWANRNGQDAADHGPGPEIVDYSGIPLNAAGRAKSLSYVAALQSEPERQCEYYAIQYVLFGPQSVTIWSETDPVSAKILAWKISGVVDRDIITIWMDGRAHPSSNAFHPTSGITTGEWRGDTLTTYTTHMKTGYLRRNGVPSSDQATYTQHIVRHEDMLAILGLIDDPIYLTEPYSLTEIWVQDPHAQITRTPQACEPINEIPRLESQDGPPHLLPGQNPYIQEMAQRYHIPEEAALGGVETMYPEFRKKLKDYVPPEKCLKYCCSTPDPALKCWPNPFAQPPEGFVREK